MTDIANLGIAVDSSQVKKGTDDLANFNKEAAKVQPGLGSIEAAARRAGVSVEEMRARMAAAGNASSFAAAGHAGFATASNKAEAASNAFNVSLSEQRAIFRLLSREASSLAGGPLADVIRSVGMLSYGAGRLTIGVTVGIVALTALTAAAVKAVEAFAQLEMHQAKIGNAIAATNGASGQTPSSIESIVQARSQSGTQSTGTIREATAELLKYRSVAGETFGEVTKLAQDVAATGFAELKGATTALGRALQDPTEAAKDLASVGLQLSSTQQKLAADLYSTGRVAEAQRVILDAVAKQVGGADAKAADTLAGSWGRLGNMIGNTFEKVGEGLAKMVKLKEVLDAISGGVKAGTDKETLLPGLIKTIPGLDILTRVAVASARKGKTSDAAQLDTANFDEANKLLKEAQERVNAVMTTLQVTARTAHLLPQELEIFNAQVSAGVLSSEELAQGLLGASDAARQIQASIEATNTARANAEVDQQLASLRSQLAVSQAITGQQQIQAQAAATYNALLLKHVDERKAEEFVMQQIANAQAEASSAVEKQTRSIKDQTALIYARMRGDEAQVAAAQAYKNAIESGADSASAAALSAATLESYTARAAEQAQRYADQMAAAAESAYQASRIGGAGGSAMANMFTSERNAFSAPTSQYGSNVSGTPGGFTTQNPSPVAVSPNPVGNEWSTPFYWVNRLSNSMDRLDTSVKDLSKTIDATLNPLYSAGHSAMPQIGYYHAASGLDMIARGPTSGDRVPFHAMVNGGERITITPAGNDNKRTYNVSNNFNFGNASPGSRRTRKQVAQGFNSSMRLM